MGLAPPPQKKGGTAPIFGLCLLWPNGRPSQLLLSSCASFLATATFKRKLSSVSLPLDRFWMNQDVKYDFTPNLTGIGDRSVYEICET